MAERVALVDYGAGNLRSVHNALLAAGAERIEITADPDAVLAADRIVLPGVGAFGACMGALKAIDGMVGALQEATGPAARPFLGVCVGMQLMADASAEMGRHAGLGWIGGTVRRLDPGDAALKVPHMGWNDVTPAPAAHALVPQGEAYFLHSYAFDADDAADVLATTDHGGAVTAAIGRGNRIGVQFHPEKSQAYGLRLLREFLKWRP